MAPDIAALLLRFHRSSSQHQESIGFVVMEVGGDKASNGFVREVSLRRIATWPLQGTANESVLLEIRAAG